MKSTKLSVALSLQLSLLIIVVASVTQAQTRQTAKIDSGDLYPIVKNRRFGFVDGRGRVVIRPQYYWAAPFSEGLAAVIVLEKRNQALLAFIDRKGRMTVRPFDGSGTKFSSGVASV